MIEVKNITKTYTDGGEGFQALRGVSFTIADGEFVAIMGPSGSGKSSLLHILGFLDSPTGGTYCFNGKEYAEYGQEEVAKLRNEEMGFVFQSFNLLAKETVLQNVLLPLFYSSIPETLWEEKATRAIEAVGLSHRIRHNAAKLSGGEKQRVAIARALVNDPTVIFADEPTGNLDSMSGGIVMEIISDLNEKHGHTIILVTHETYTAEHASRIIRLHDGRIESDEPVTKRRTAGEGFAK